MDPAQVCEAFVASCAECIDRYSAAPLPPERKQLNGEMSEFVMQKLLQDGMASIEAAAVAALELLLVLTDTEKLALGIDIAAKAGAMQAALQCIIEHKGTTRVPKIACQVRWFGEPHQLSVLVPTRLQRIRPQHAHVRCALTRLRLACRGAEVRTDVSLQLSLTALVFLRPTQVIDVLGGRLKNRDEAARIGVCTNIIQALVPSTLKDADFVKVRLTAPLGRLRGASLRILLCEDIHETSPLSVRRLLLRVCRV